METRLFIISKTAFAITLAQTQESEKGTIFKQPVQFSKAVQF